MDDRRLVSPKELFDAAKQHELGGRAPVTEDDWTHIVNFLAANISFEMAVPGCLIVCKLYKCLLEDDAIKDIAGAQSTYQALRKSGMSPADAESLTSMMFPMMDSHPQNNPSAIEVDPNLINVGSDYVQ